MLTHRRRLDRKLEHMRRVPLLAERSRHQLEAIAHLVDEVDVGPGRVLMRRGEIPREFILQTPVGTRVRPSSSGRR